MTLKLKRDSEGRPCSRCRDKAKRYATGWCPMHNQMVLDEMRADPRYEPDDAHDGGIPGPEVRDDLYERPERW